MYRALYGVYLLDISLVELLTVEIRLQIGPKSLQTQTKLRKTACCIGKMITLKAEIFAFLALIREKCISQCLGIFQISETRKFIHTKHRKFQKRKSFHYIYI